MRLYEYDTEIAKLIDEFEAYAAEHDGELPDEMVLQMDELSIGKTDKLINYGRWCKSLVAEEAAYKTEADTIAKKRKSLKNRIEWVKNAIQGSLPVGQKIQDPTVTLNYRKSQAVIGSLLDSEDYDKHPLLVETKKSWSKKRIKEALKSGREIEGAELKDRHNLQVK